jgi:putative oxidoreductase
MNLGFLVIRIIVGGLFMGHGAQKLWGSFGGHGIAGTGAFFESLGLRPGRAHATAAGLAEFLGGILIALGLLTPIGALLVSSVMVTAIRTVHGVKGPWATNGGYEYNVVLLAVAFVLSAAGPGSWSLDHALGLHLAGAAWAIAQLLVALAGAFLALAMSEATAARAREPAARPRSPHPSH